MGQAVMDTQVYLVLIAAMAMKGFGILETLNSQKPTDPHRTEFRIGIQNATTLDHQRELRPAVVFLTRGSPSCPNTSIIVPNV